MPEPQDWSFKKVKENRGWNEEFLVPSFWAHLYEASAWLYMEEMERCQGDNRLVFKMSMSSCRKIGKSLWPERICRVRERCGV